MKKTIGKLQFITHPVAGRSVTETVAEVCSAGIDWIQLRMKESTESEMLKLAFEIKKITDRFNATLIINDHVNVAQQAGADGVHLGYEDMHPLEARKILGEDFIIGGTANSHEDCFRLIRAGIDYIGLGPFRQTATKINLKPVLGHEGIKINLKVLKAFGEKIPVIAVGGILPNDVNKLLTDGCFGIAVSSGIISADSPMAATKEFISKFKQVKDEALTNSR